MTYLLPILAVIIGFLIVFIFRPSINSNLKLLLAFSGAFLLAITVFDFLPEIYSVEQSKTVGLFIMLGILLQIFLEFFSKGAEHGHVHIQNDNKLFPWLLFISLCIHALLEGYPIHQNHNILYGVIVHKIPVAMVLSIFFLSSQFSYQKTTLFLIVFALMTPLGAYAAETITALKSISKPISALVVGIFLHISTTILFESSQGHKFNITKLSVIATAIVIAYFI